jgi:O-antigen/teichoic acid export membrane protein
MNMFNRDLLQAIRGVALPAFAAAHRNDQDLEAHYAHATAIILALAWPFYGLLSLYALEALRLLYGAQWDTAAPLVPIFCLAGAIAAINALTTSALIAIGEVGRVTSFDLLMQPLRVLLIGLAAVLIRTPEACALAYLLSAVVSLPVFLKIKEVVIPTDMSRAWLNLASTVAVTATTLAPAAGHVFMMRGAVHEPLPLLQVVGVVGLSVLLWFAAVIVFKHPISREPAFERVKVMAFGILRLGPQRPKPE